MPATDISIGFELDVPCVWQKRGRDPRLEQVHQAWRGAQREQL